mgnify:CR=1 FL=1
MNSRNKKAQLDFYRDWCLTVIRFLIAAEPPSEENERFLAQSEKTIIKAYNDGNLVGFKYAYNDYNSDAKALLNAEQFAELDLDLRSRLGTGLKGAERKRQKEIAHILKRGSVRDEDEYRLLLDHAEEIHADRSRGEELKAVNLLLKAGLAKGG